MTKIDHDPGNDDDDYDDDTLPALKNIVHPALSRFLAREKKLVELEEAGKKNKADKTFSIVSKTVNEIRRITTINIASIEFGSCTKVYLQDGKDFSRIALVKGLISHKMITKDEKNASQQIIVYVAIDGSSDIAYIYQQRVKKDTGQNKEDAAL